MRTAVKRLALILVFILIGLVVALVFARQAWQGFLQDNHIERFEWQELSLSASGLSVSRLEIIQAAPERSVDMNATEVNLSWRVPQRPSTQWRDWLPRLTALSAGDLHLELQAGSEPGVEDAPLETGDGLASFDNLPEQWSDWAPPQIDVEHFTAILPCATGRCELDGSLALHSTEADLAAEPGSPLPVKAHVQLNRDGHQVVVSATLDSISGEVINEALSEASVESAANRGYLLTAELSIDDTRHLTLTTNYQRLPENAALLWQGNVAMPELPQTGWLLSWLQTWYPVEIEELLAQPDKGSLSAGWQLRGPTQHFLTHASGAVKATARIPQAWPAPGIGSIKGDLEVALKLDQGQWLPETLQADLELSQPGAWVNQLPPPLQLQRLNLSVRPAQALPGKPGVSPSVLLPLAVIVKARGNAEVELSSHLAVATAAPWRVQFGETRLTANLAQWNIAGWQITRPELALQLTGEATPSGLNLKFGKPSTASAKRISATPNAEQPLQLHNLDLVLAGASLSARYKIDPTQIETLIFEGPLALSAKQIRHPQLLTQSWRFKGNARADLEQLGLSGVVRAGSGASANLKTQIPYGKASGQAVNVAAEMRVSGQKEIDGLGRVLVAWPELLSASGGTVSANVTAKLAPGQALALDGKLTFTDVGGTWDRTAWRKMNGALQAALAGDRLTVNTSQLTLEEINPGIAVGPVVLAGDYHTALQNLTSGQLTLTHASADVLGGEVSVAPGSWDLAAAPVTVPLQLDRLSVAQLLRVYPAEGLAGTGILSGTIPLLVDPASGVRVKRGRIDALEPGGQLQLSAERLRALGQTSETMNLVAKALENFRYSVLDSDIDYDENGTLMLNLHLKGNSPEVGEGRPVVLNINLEENIPALLTSLQLSGRVTDAVTERVKKMLERRGRQPQEDLIE